MKTSSVKEFVLEPGTVNHTLTSSGTPIEFFNLIFSPTQREEIMKWTNIRAQNKIDNAKRGIQKRKKWFNMKLSEFNGFIGTLYIMGIVRFPCYRMYWSANSRIFTNQGVRDLFTFQRFQDIFSSLCFYSSDSYNANDKLYKIRPVITSMLSNSQTHYIPKKVLAVDESMISFSGRHKLIQFMPLKPIKVGFKAFLLCETESSYVISWKLYTNSNTASDFGKTYDTVRSLVDGIEGEGYILYMDRYYISPQLLLTLKELDIGACSTIKLNRLHLSKTISEQISALKEDDIKYFVDPQDLLLSCWFDHKKVLLMLSNFHNIEEVIVNRRVPKKRKRNSTLRT